MLPFRPQSIDEQRQRYPHALQHLFDCRGERAKRLRPKPSDLYGNIFDFEDGLRLLISREQYDDTGPYLHISASPVEEGKLTLSYKLDDPRFHVYALNRFHEISDDTQPLGFMGLSPGNIPHFGRKL